MSSYGNVVRYTGREWDGETGFYHYRHRSLAAELGRFGSRDPVGYKSRSGLYRYVGNNPGSLTDPSGLWAPHNKFPGYPEFDWDLEDRGDTHPMRQPCLHFRPLDDSDADLAKACQSCNYDRFVRAGHDMQDFFSHYGQAFRAYRTAGHLPCNAIQCGLKRVGLPNIPPDDSGVYKDAFKAAQRRTEYWLDRWNDCCEKDAAGAWRPKSPQIARCSDGPPHNEYGDTAPPPTPNTGAIARWLNDLERAICECYATVYGIPMR